MEYWNIYTSISESIRHSDNKATAVLGVQGIFIGFVFTKVLDADTLRVLRTEAGILFFFGFLLNVISLVLSFLCLIPVLKSHLRKSALYFGSIAAEFEDESEYRDHLYALMHNDADINREISQQIYINARIAWRKYRYAQYAITVFICSLLVWFTFLCFIVLTGFGKR